MSQLFQQSDLEALLSESQEACAFLRQYPHILDTILNQITALQEVKYETNRAGIRQLIIVSPDDVEGRHRTKRVTHWTGYSVHLTETCAVIVKT